MVKEGILIIGHGSRSNESERVFGLQAQRIREMGFDNVEVGFNEFSERTIEHAMKRMADNGVDIVYAVPMFIITGIHLTEDVPGKLGIPEGSSGGMVNVNGKDIEIRYATAFGDDPAVAELILKKISGLRNSASHRSASDHCMMLIPPSNA